MAKGENAEKHWTREYWSRRHPGLLSWGKWGKHFTHRRERAEARRREIAEAKKIEEDRA
jgi:hypothetical protein